MSWERWFGKMEGLPNGRIGDSPRRFGSAGESSSPKAKYDITESRVAMRVLVEKSPMGLGQIGMVRATRRDVELSRQRKEENGLPGPQDQGGKQGAQKDGPKPSPQPDQQDLDPRDKGPERTDNKPET